MHSEVISQRCNEVNNYIFLETEINYKARMVIKINLKLYTSHVSVWIITFDSINIQKSNCDLANNRTNNSRSLPISRRPPLLSRGWLRFEYDVWPIIISETRLLLPRRIQPFRTFAFVRLWLFYCCNDKHILPSLQIITCDCRPIQSQVIFLLHVILHFYQCNLQIIHDFFISYF